VSKQTTARTFCRRGYLESAAKGPRRHIPSWFVKELRRVDRGLECHWIPERWCFYRVTQPGAAKNDDWLIHELELDPGDELGSGVVDQIRKYDKTKNGSLDPHQANRRFLEGVSRNPGGEAREKEESEISAGFAEDCWEFARGKVRRNIKLEKPLEKATNKKRAPGKKAGLKRKGALSR
jgi:hypothetical protein